MSIYATSMTPPAACFNSPARMSSAACIDPGQPVAVGRDAAQAGPVLGLRDMHMVGDHARRRAAPVGQLREQRLGPAH
ncbi:hypothetical protein VB636_00050, partial [Paracoccus sp. APAP_BH8]|uniref:hypothetical protein n=1 Tax=Paracoccus sp. APAP_BH8 TaxID=3110237 RepID=UPI002FD7D20C